MREEYETNPRRGSRGCMTSEPFSLRLGATGGMRGRDVMGNIGDIPCERVVKGLTRVCAVGTEQKLFASRENDIEAACAVRSGLGLISVDDDRHPHGY